MATIVSFLAPMGTGLTRMILSTSWSWCCWLTMMSLDLPYVCLLNVSFSSIRALSMSSSSWQNSLSLCSKLNSMSTSLSVFLSLAVRRHPYVLHAPSVCLFSNKHHLSIHPRPVVCPLLSSLPITHPHQSHTTSIWHQLHSSMCSWMGWCQSDRGTYELPLDLQLEFCPPLLLKQFHPGSQSYRIFSLVFSYLKGLCDRDSRMMWKVWWWHSQNWLRICPISILTPALLSCLTTASVSSRWRQTCWDGLSGDRVEVMRMWTVLNITPAKYHS